MSPHHWGTAVLDSLPVVLYPHSTYFHSFYFLFSPEDVFVDFRERGETTVWEKHQLVASHRCWSGYWTHSHMGWRSHQLNYTARALPLLIVFWSKMQTSYNFIYKNFSMGPGWCGLVDWALACEPKGHQFSPQSGHRAGLQARSPEGGAWEATTHWCFSPSLFLPPIPSLKIN